MKILKFNNWQLTAVVIFCILIGYSLCLIVGYKDKDALYKYTNSIIEECLNESKQERIPLYREITPQGINLTILQDNNTTMVEASLI